jgi:hypothetical protein
MSTSGMSFVTISVLAVFVVQSLSLTYGLIHFAPNVLDWNIALMWYFFLSTVLKASAMLILGVIASICTRNKSTATSERDYGACRTKSASKTTSVSGSI